MLIALSKKHHWKINLLDVKFAFLNGELKEEVYLTQPRGFIEHKWQHLVCKLKRALIWIKTGIEVMI